MGTAEGHTHSAEVQFKACKGINGRIPLCEGADFVGCAVTFIWKHTLFSIAARALSAIIGAHTEIAARAYWKCSGTWFNNTSLRSVCTRADTESIVSLTVYVCALRGHDSRAIESYLALSAIGAHSESLVHIALVVLIRHVQGRGLMHRCGVSVCTRAGTESIVSMRRIIPHYACIYVP